MLSELSQSQSQSIIALKEAAVAATPVPTTPAAQVLGSWKVRQTGNLESEVHCCRFSVDDEYFALGLHSGAIEIYHTNTGSRIQTLFEKTPNDVCTCTNLIFRPNMNSAQTRNVVVGIYVDGKIKHWHATSGNKLGDTIEQGNQIFAIDYSPDGARFATGGSDNIVRVYEEIGRKLIHTLYAGRPEVTAGHSNKIFSVKFHPRDPNIIISAGWDNTIQFWDLRSNVSQRSVFGPHICGDAIDLDDSGDRFIAACHTTTDQLQLWDFRKGALICTIPWNNSDGNPRCPLNAVQFSHPRIDPTASKTKVSGSGSAVATRLILAGGGSDGGEAKLFNAETKKCVAAVCGIHRAVYSVSMTRDSKYALIAGSFKGFMLMEIDLTMPGGDFTY